MKVSSLADRPRNRCCRGPNGASKFGLDLCDYMTICCFDIIWILLHDQKTTVSGNLQSTGVIQGLGHETWRKTRILSHRIFDSFDSRVRCYLRLDIYKLEACVYCWHLLQHLLDFRAKQPLTQVPFALKQLLLKSERMKRLVSHGDVTQSFLGHHKWLFELGTPEPSQCILQSSHRIMFFFCSLAPKVVQTLVMDREPGTRPRCDDIFSEPQRSGSRVTHSLKILKPS